MKRPVPDSPSTPRSRARRRRSFSRRELLRVTALAAAAAPFGGTATAAAQPPQTQRPRESALLSVGYLLGSEQVSDLRVLAHALRANTASRRPESGTSGTSMLRVVDAAALPLGDTELVAAPLRVRVFGLYPPRVLRGRQRATLPSSVWCDALFPAPEGSATGQPLRFAAWAMRRDSTVQAAQPVAYDYPIDWQGMPGFELRVRWPSGQELALTNTFTVDDEAGRPRLLRGLYLLGLAAGAFAGVDLPVQQYAASASGTLAALLIAFESGGTR